jgi:hypothetical protein
LEPPGIAAPRNVHGPVMFGAEWIAMRAPVEKRKYVPSARRINAGSWALPQAPEHGPGTANVVEMMQRAEKNMATRWFNMTLMDLARLTARDGTH